MAQDSNGQTLRQRLTDKVGGLESGPHTGLPVAVTKRFFEIGGLDLGGLLAIELFTTVIPLVLIGFSYLKGFSSGASVGEIFIRQLGVRPPLDAVVRSAFGSAASLKSVWTLAGLTTFLLWGIPMSLTVARMFSLAWRRPSFPFWHQLWRGATWFITYLVATALTQRVGALRGQHVPRIVFVLVSFGVPFIFWALSPVLLVRERIRGWKDLMHAGMAGLVIEATVLRFAVRLVFPALLKGWQGFGPIGVAMALMTWSGVLGVAWVFTACAGAVMFERSAAAISAEER